MRIDPNPGAGGPGASARAETPAESHAHKADAAVRGGAPGDRVEVSENARHVQRVLEDAVRAAGTAPEIRTDVVERGRALLDSGRLGGDSEALASAIIGDLLDRP
jgi:hypothetical protein